MPIISKSRSDGIFRQSPGLCLLPLAGHGTDPALFGVRDKACLLRCGPRIASGTSVRCLILSTTGRLQFNLNSIFDLSHWSNKLDYDRLATIVRGWMNQDNGNLGDVLLLEWNLEKKVSLWGERGVCWVREGDQWMERSSLIYGAENGKLCWIGAVAVSLRWLAIGMMTDNWLKI